MARTASGALVSNTHVSVLFGESVDFTLNGSSLETSCAGLLCEKCEYYEDQPCVTCSSKTDTLTLSDDFVLGICGGRTIVNNQIAEKVPAAVGCENSGGLPVPHGRVLKPKAWSNCGNGKRYLKVGFVLTNRLLSSVYKNNLAHAKTAIVGMLAEVNLIYENQLKVKLQVGEIYTLTDPQRRPKPNCATGWNSASSVRTALDKFTSWASCVNQHHVGIWHLIDQMPNRQGSGEAYIGTMCNRALNTGVSIYSHQLWRTVAHEIGHNFNARHPLVNGAVAKVNAGIMGYGDAKVNNKYQFDEGNKGHICAKLQSVDGKCMAMQTSQSATCGNGLREGNEECECPSGKSCACCKDCKLRSFAECNPSETFPGCCSKQCKFESMAKTCDGGAGYCKKGSCVNPFPTLQLCGVNEATCRVGLSRGGNCLFNGYLSNKKSLHIAEDGAICKNRGTCKNGVCRNQQPGTSSMNKTVDVIPLDSVKTPTNKPSEKPTKKVIDTTAVCNKSTKSCSQLPEFAYTTTRQKNVCGASKKFVAGEECVSGMNQGKAEDVCKSIGARLCTSRELTDGVGVNTGCDFNWKYVWSSTPCGQGKFYAVRKKRYTGRKCLSQSETKTSRSKVIGVRCCADRETTC